MIDDKNVKEKPQCQFFVIRKKRLCRMTVRPGRNYCGEHEPKPAGDDQVDTRVPCPLDPKHTCYASKLEKHLSICNAKQDEHPPYIIKNINICGDTIESIRKPLSEIPRDQVMKLIDKIEVLYEKHVEQNITTAPDYPIHYVLLEDFSAKDRAESSLRHLRQASSLMHIIETEGLVQDRNCYVELGAGKGQLSFFAHNAWCTNDESAVLLIDRASVRHKKDNKIKCERISRIRADLADVDLTKLPEVDTCERVVGFAKHLCGVATDYALRSMTSPGVLPKSSGVAVCTCCHHRCELTQYVGYRHLADIGITPEELNIMLGLVSWATCGDGRSRERRNEENKQVAELDQTNIQKLPVAESKPNESSSKVHENSQENLDSISSIHSPENSNINSADNPENTTNTPDNATNNTTNSTISPDNATNSTINSTNNPENAANSPEDKFCCSESKGVANQINLSQDVREKIGKKAKMLIDWGRVLYLKEKGFDAKLMYYVQSTVSLENVCILAKKY